MSMYLLIGLLLLFSFMVFKGLNKQSKQQDSVLKRRAVFSLNEQLAFARLKETLPTHTILAQVSYDALITTKYSRTRNKYRNLLADFVVLDASHQIVAIIGLDDPNVLKRLQQKQYKDALLSMAGYRVIRYDEVPTYRQIRRDFFGELRKDWHETEAQELDTSLKKYNFYHEKRKLKVWG